MEFLKHLIFFTFILQLQIAGAQIYLSEGFESGIRPEGWTQEYVHPPVHTEPWRFRNGGHSPNDGNWLVPPGDEDITRNPPSAYEGTYNAIFFKQGDNNERTKLITPSLDLEGGVKVELSFYLCQIPWTFGGVTSWDVLRVYYKVAEGAPWILLQEYLDPVYDWELQTVVLPDLSSDYHIAFEGHTRWGYGTCIDNVVVEEKGEQQLWVGSLEFNQQFEPAIPAGSADVPLMRIDVRIFGNTGSAILGHIDFKSLNTSDDDIIPAGVKLFHTPTQVFNTLQQVGEGIDFVSGTASFTVLDYSLPQGRSYLWITVDIDPYAAHGNILDVMVPAGGMMIGDTLYPATNHSPPGKRIIYETIYFQDFEGAHGWELTGEFEVDTPNGMGGSPGNSNPERAFSGIKVLGTDLTGLGANPYNYEPNLTAETAYRTTSPVIDAFYYKDLSIFFQRHLNIEVWDEASVQLSRDNGTTWETVWLNNGFISDFEWTQVNKPLPERFWRTGELKIRFQLGPTDNQNNYSGWNIDDVFITGEFISRDVGVTEWIAPLSGCGLTADEPVTVRIENFGGADINDPFPIGYSLDGGLTWTTDTCNEIIPVGGAVIFTFPTRADLSEPGLRPQVLARTMLAGDQWPANDQFATRLLVIPTITPPYSEGFEAGDGYWYAPPGSIWEHGTPAGSVIKPAFPGSKSWVTGLSRRYGDMISQYGQIIFNDNFQSQKQWTFTGEFERNIPIDLPWFAWSGLYCAGTDLSGQGSLPYMYEKGITPQTAHSAISPAIDVSAFNNLNVSFARWLNIIEGDSVMLAASPDNGITWHTIWKNTEGAITDEYWEIMDYDIHDSLAYSTQLRIKFSLFHTSPDGETAHGLNIDDFIVSGDLVNNVPFSLNSPCFDLTGLTHPVFDARLWTDTEPGVDGATLMYSTDGGSSWLNVSNASGFDGYWNWYTGQPVSALQSDGWSGQTGGWMRVRHLLPPELAGEENVKFRLTFMADEHNNDFDGIAMDDVKIYEAPHDAGVVAILDPVSGCELGEDRNLTLRIRNFGIRDIEEGDALKIGYHINRDGELQTAEESITLDTPLPAGSTLDIEMNRGFDFSKGGEYQVVVFTIEKEPLFYQSEANDLYSGIILVEKPYFSLGADISTARPDTIVLAPDAGPGIFEYLWQDGSTDPVYHLQSEGTYSVTVTNHIGCSESGSITIYPLITDIGVSDIISPVSACELGSGVRITVTIENFGTDTLRAGDTVPVGAGINDADGFYENLVLSENFYPGETIEFTFSQELDFSLPGTYNLKLYTGYPNDFDASNDTLEVETDVFGYPSVGLGPDREISAMEYMLDAGGGFTEYLWHDGSTGQEFLIDRPGQEMYSVHVTDINGCSASDSVFITLYVPDLAIDQVLSPAATACILSENPPVSARIINAGNIAVPPGETLSLEYRINGGTPLREEIILVEDFLPGATFDHVFSEPADVVPGNSYEFTLLIDWAPDVNRENDTLRWIVDAVATTRVDLGNAYQVVTALEHTLDAGEGFASWLWHDGSAERTYTINTPGIHTCSVTVTDAKGCVDSDQVQVLLLVPDIGVTEIIHPQTACEPEEVTIAIKNHGNANISMTTVIRAGILVNGHPAVTEDVVLAATFGTGETIYHTFSGAPGMAMPGNYQVTAYTIYSADLNNANDSMTAGFEILGLPAIDLGNGSDTLRGAGRIELTAPPGYASYLWQDGSPGNIFTVDSPVSDWFHVLVTDHNDCQAVDSVYVKLYPPGLEIVSVSGPGNACESVSPENVGLQIKNAGMYPLAAGETIDFYYRINQMPVAGESYTLTNPLDPGAVLSYTFIAGAVLPGPGTYDISIWFEYGDEGNPMNSSTVHKAMIHGFPSVDLVPGQDTLYASLPLTLDAGEGFVSYVWNDGSTLQTLDVTGSGMYRVTVVDRYGCPGSDSVVVQSPLGTVGPGKEEVDIRVYPNPVSGILNVIIRSDVMHDRLGFELVSPAGVTIYSNEVTGADLFSKQIDTGRFPAGLYIMRINAGSSYTTRVIVIN